ncbi:MAG: hypothetical protein IJN12_03625 [Clostridia bacterium]|nr:hypothetical protein [Clostridia bacterium]
MDNQIENNANTEILKKQISDLETELFRTKADAEVNLAIAMARPRNIEAAKVMLNKNGILTENGIDSEILKNNIATLKQENPWLFEDSAKKELFYDSGISNGFIPSPDDSQLSDEEYYKRIMK